MFKPSGDLRRDYNRLSSEYMKQKDRILSYQEQIASLRNSNKTLEKALAREKKCRKKEAAQKDAIIQALMNKVAHLETQTGTGQTPEPLRHRHRLTRKRGYRTQDGEAIRKRAGSLAMKNIPWNLLMNQRWMKISSLVRLA